MVIPRGALGMPTPCIPLLCLWDQESYKIIVIFIYSECGNYFYFTLKFILIPTANQTPLNSGLVVNLSSMNVCHEPCDLWPFMLFCPVILVLFVIFFIRNQHLPVTDTLLQERDTLLQEKLSQPHGSKAEFQQKYFFTCFGGWREHEKFWLISNKLGRVFIYI